MLSNRRIQNLKSPTNSTFFSTCLNLLRKVNYSSSFNELRDLFSYMSNSRGIKYDDNFSFLEDLLFTDMEDVITDLDIKTSTFENENEYTYLTDILKELNCPKNIDLMSIDVEGHELNTLNGIDFEMFLPKLLIIETNKVSLREIRKIIPEKYTLIKEDGLNSALIYNE